MSGLDVIVVAVIVTGTVTEVVVEAVGVVGVAGVVVRLLLWRSWERCFMGVSRSSGSRSATSRWFYNILCLWILKSKASISSVCACTESIFCGRES